MLKERLYYNGKRVKGLTFSEGDYVYFFFTKLIFETT